MGFFDNTDQAPKPVAAAKPRRPAARDREVAAPGCDGCRLRHHWPTLASPKMPPARGQGADILLAAGSPTLEADRAGRPLVDPALSILRKAIPPREYPRIAWQNVVRCHGGEKEPAGAAEASQCSPYLTADLDAISPAGILGVGDLAYKAFITDLPAKYNLYDMHGIWLPVMRGGKPYWFMPTFGPEQLLTKKGEIPRNLDESPMWPVMRANVRRFFSEVDTRPAPYFHTFDPASVVIVRTEEEALAYYARMDPTLIGVDLETKHLRPYAKEARWLTCALSDGTLTMAYAVDHPEQRNPWAAGFTLAALTDAKEWVATNAAFELAWLVYHAGLEIDPRRMHDTAAVARLQFERESLTSLACTSRIVLGVNVKGLTAVDAKRIMDYPLAEVLPYNGLDAQASVLIHKRTFPNFQQKESYDRLIQAIASTTQMQLMGLPLDRKRNAELKAKWQQKADTALAASKLLYEVRQFELTYAKEFSISSGDDVGQALTAFARIALPKTKTGFKTDEDTLLAAAPDNPLVRCVIDYRKATKNVSTYIDSYAASADEHVDEQLHPCYSILYVRTFRSSSEDINIQNAPSRRDIELRGQVVAPAGQIMVAFDYGQIQVRIVGISSKDDNLCNSILNGVDMHADWRDRLLDRWPEYFDHVSRRSGQTDQGKVLKAARNEIKNDFVFASLFGSYADSCARNLNAPVELMRGFQGEFWGQFPKVQAWHKQQRLMYKETGSSRLLTGHIRHGILTGNEPINTPIQGLEAMVVFDSMNACAALSRAERDPFLHPRLEVHDDLTFFLPDDGRLEGYIARIVPLLTACRYPWQILPWTIEGKMGYSWDAMTEFAVYKGDYVR